METGIEMKLSINTVLGVAILATTTFSAYNLNYLKIQQEAQNKKDFTLLKQAQLDSLTNGKLAIAKSPRIANIINYQMSQQNLTTLTANLAKQAIELEKEMIKDSIDDRFYAALTKLDFSKEAIPTAFGYRVRDKWSMFLNKESPFYKDFPTGAALAFNYEQVPFIKCDEANEKPQIHFTSMSNSGVPFDANFIPENSKLAYRVEFKGKFNPIKDRVIIKVECTTNK